MAKRKRLTPAQPEYLNAPGAAPEIKSALDAGPVHRGQHGSPTAAPIAQVAGEAAATAALQEVSAALQSARAEGRMVQKIPLGQIVADHLRRDRMMADAEDLTALVDSIREHGQRNPIEVMALPDGTFGLISGWRRLSALELLAQETGAARFDTVLALLRRPEDASHAYVSMVEENEIRVGLSYYERARVVALATADGVFPTESAALLRLFRTASRAKRSKIRSFLTVWRALDDVLHFPTQLGERQGLALARALDGDRAGVLARLDGLNAQTPEEEQAALAVGLSPAATDSKATALKPAPTSDVPAADVSPRNTGLDTIELRPGVFLKNEGGYLHPRLVLEGPNVGVTFRERLEHWLKTGK